MAGSSVCTPEEVQAAAQQHYVGLAGGMGVGGMGMEVDGILDLDMGMGYMNPSQSQPHQSPTVHSQDHGYLPATRHARTACPTISTTRPNRCRPSSTTSPRRLMLHTPSTRQPLPLLRTLMRGSRTLWAWGWWRAAATTSIRGIRFRIWTMRGVIWVGTAMVLWVRWGAPFRSPHRLRSRGSSSIRRRSRGRRRGLLR
ncbi:hypothetical protein FA13DRAFT_250918 [Coprinellus micaceus]|uniref:Uncharacterized protein n=1 Tax=Coprinellus micaceus TaxID=71717 RepID=A0A4Y7TEM5_COPMI|nr:hypothetical protein FA13DRAFT_250918 [Coprinellus micaceus]